MSTTLQMRTEQVQRREIVGRAPKAEGDLIYFVGTTEAVDAHDSIVRRDGLSLDRFRQNPVVLLDHDNATDSVAGRVEDIRNIDRPVKGIEFGIRFASEESPRAAQAERLARAGFLRGASIGFIPQRVRRDLSDPERQLLGLGPYGYVVEESELVELTVVPVGSNPEALKRAVAAGVIEAGDMAWCREPVDDAEAEAAVDATLAALVEAVADLPDLIASLTASMITEIQAMGQAIATAIARLTQSQQSDVDRALDDARKQRAELARTFDVYANRISETARGRNGGASQSPRTTTTDQEAKDA